MLPANLRRYAEWKPQRLQARRSTREQRWWRRDMRWRGRESTLELWVWWITSKSGRTLLLVLHWMKGRPWFTLNLRVLGMLSSWQSWPLYPTIESKNIFYFNRDFRNSFKHDEKREQQIEFPDSAYSESWPAVHWYVRINSSYDQQRESSLQFYGHESYAVTFEASHVWYGQICRLGHLLRVSYGQRCVTRVRREASRAMDGRFIN